MLNPMDLSSMGLSGDDDPPQKAKTKPEETMGEKAMRRYFQGAAERKLDHDQAVPGQRYEEPIVEEGDDYDASRVNPAAARENARGASRDTIRSAMVKATTPADRIGKH